MIGAWGPPVTVPAVDPVPRPAIAVDGRGDVALAWREETNRGSVIRAAYLKGGKGAPSRRTLLASSSGRAVAGLAAVLDRHGRLTVVWVDRGTSTRRRPGHIMVRAVRLTPPGRWSTPQAIARVTPFAYAQPQLATAPEDDTVALTYNSRTRTAPGIAIAWAPSGRPFGAPHAIPSGRLGFLQEPSLGFDARGRLRLAGVADCDDEARSRGVLLTASGVRRRFRGPLTIAPAPVNHLRLTLATTGPSVGMASWLRAGCSTSEDLSGAPMAAALLEHSVTSAVTLDPADGRGLTAVRAPGGATDVSWISYPASAPGGAILDTRVLSARPPVSSPPAMLGDDEWTPTTADWIGDQALTTALPEQLTGRRATAAREPDGTVWPSPLPAVPWPVAAGANDGRVLAAAAPDTRSTTLSVWRATD